MCGRREIRPHHGLCAEFFRGEGYSGDFTRNMGEVLAELDRNDSPVRLVLHEDIICKSCPNIGKCGEKAPRYDLKVLELCGIDEGSEINWKDFRELVRKRIILRGRLPEVCSDCIWADICNDTP